MQRSFSFSVLSIYLQIYVFFFNLIPLYIHKSYAYMSIMFNKSLDNLILSPRTSHVKGKLSVPSLVSSFSIWTRPPWNIQFTPTAINTLSTLASIAGQINLPPNQKTRNGSQIFIYRSMQQSVQTAFRASAPAISVYSKSANFTQLAKADTTHILTYLTRIDAMLSCPSCNAAQSGL